MKKSTQVPAMLIAALAAALSAAGCSCDNGYDECMDAAGNILPDSACGPAGRVGAHWTHVSTGGFGSGGGYGGSFGG